MRWLCELLGFPAGAQGILASGGSMANFIALAAARRAMTPGNVREDGLGDGPRLVVYASDQVHSCVDKAVDLLGIGTRYLRKIPCDDALPPARWTRSRAAVAEDRARGPASRDRGGQRGNGEHRRRRPAGRDRRLLRAGEALVPRRRRLRRDGADRPVAGAAVRGDGARRLAGRRPAQVAVRALRGGRDAGARGPIGWPTRSASSPSTSPPIPTARSRARPGSRSAGPELSRGFKALKVFMGLLRHGRSGYARRHRARRRARALPLRRGGPPAGASSGWRPRRCRS